MGAGPTATGAPHGASREREPQYVVAFAGSRGDVHPFMRVAAVLRAVGCEVACITHRHHERHRLTAALRTLAASDALHARRARVAARCAHARDAVALCREWVQRMRRTLPG